MAASNWTVNEIKNASTANENDFLNKIEKTAITYLNLARLYPKKIANIKMRQSNLGSYRQSLYEKLNAIRPMPSVKADKEMSISADSLSKEQYASGITGHIRKNYTKNRRTECCSYGDDIGKGIIMQPLIDKGVTLLGHRKICLTPHFTKVSIALNEHPRDSKSCVIEFNLW